MIHGKLKGKMRELGVTQEELAKDLDLSVAGLNLKLSGRSSFRVNEALAIMKRLDIPIEEISIFFE